jgi:hypothetical protein
MSAPTRTDFDRVARASARVSLGLVKILEQVERDPALRVVGDRVFQLLGQQLAFSVAFEQRLLEVADYLSAWRHLCGELGRAPDREVFEALLAREPAETVAEPEPAAVVEQPASQLPVVEAEPSPVADEDPGRELAEQLLLRDRTRTRTAWERNEPSGSEPAA